SAFVYYISPNQVNVLAPADTLSGVVQVVVTTAAGASAPASVQLQTALPAFFRAAQEYVLASDLNGLATANARPLDTIVLWGSGFGPTSPATDPGVVAGNANPLLNPVTIRIGQAAATVLYAGVTGAGVCQLNTVVPDLPNGDYPVVAEVAGVRTASIARLRIAR
ncbi:MAG: hypothetical protein ACRD96_20460, partial [Bryobacteraceae bacterium]